MLDPLTLTLATASAALAGYIVGEISRRNLNTLRYRLDEEAGVAPPAGSRHWVPVVTAAALATLTLGALLGNQPLLSLPLLPLAVGGPWLAAVDVDVQRLPNRVVGPLAAFTVTITIVVAAMTSWAVALLALIGAGIAAVVLLLTHVLRPSSLGFGDVKVGITAGFALGIQGPGAVVLALILGSAAALIWAKATRRQGAFAYGPWLLLGFWTAFAVSAVVNR